MTLSEQRAEVERLAAEAFGEQAGQVIVGKKHVYVFVLDPAGDRKVLHIEHGTLAVPAALAALRVLADLAITSMRIEGVPTEPTTIQALLLLPSDDV